MFSAPLELNVAAKSIMFGAGVSAVALFLQQRFALTRKNRKEDPVFTINFTGAQTIEKSACIEALRQELTSKGYNVYCVPEVPLLLQSAGAMFPGQHGGEKLMNYLKYAIELQLNLEDTLHGLARSCLKRAVLVLNGGSLDTKAYVPKNIWKKLIHDTGLNEIEQLVRYDLVVHLSDNEESMDCKTHGLDLFEGVKPDDAAILDAWNDHPNRVIIEKTVIGEARKKKSVEVVVSYLKELRLAHGCEKVATLNSILGGFF